MGSYSIHLLRICLICSIIGIGSLGKGKSTKCKSHSNKCTLKIRYDQGGWRVDRWVGVLSLL